eukprot:tig00021348_g20538.t1
MRRRGRRAGLQELADVCRTGAAHAAPLELEEQRRARPLRPAAGAGVRGVPGAEPEPAGAAPRRLRPRAQAPAPAAPPRPARLTGAGCGALLEALGQNGGLRRLDLASNGLTDDGPPRPLAGAAAAALRRNATLTHLNLEGNPAPALFAAVAGAAGEAAALQELALDARVVSAQGARELAGALARSRSLRSLRLRGAQLRDDEGRALAKGVAESAALEELDLLGGNLSPHAHVALLEALHLSPRVAAKFFFECDFY